ncbi:hypothetical protein [Lysinibacillus sp. G4S2]|uniref:hypothetical protein n=1 Tax=Lysinibacillus sp. G4S2 TaxID=3055859 RepID=UPI0025A177C3|nr:hypothetical protein [Lysinibacillus sp. G4S2]MDM5246910.1 hypothetical protein [Lysinibacillus sp. G4S2]
MFWLASSLTGIGMFSNCDLCENEAVAKKCFVMKVKRQLQNTPIFEGGKVKNIRWSRASDGCHGF